MTNDRDEAIAARAYELWVESGYVHGHDREHWRQAQRELAGTVQSEHVTKVKPRHDDGVSPLPAQDDDPVILHRVPESITQGSEPPR